MSTRIRCTPTLNSTCTISCPEQKEGNTGQAMGRLRTIRATIYNAVTITAVCGPPLLKEPQRWQFLTLPVVQKYRGIPVFWRVSKPEKLQADRLWCDTVRAPNQRFTRWPSLATLRKYLSGHATYGINLARGTEFWPFNHPDSSVSSGAKHSGLSSINCMTNVTHA
jgi:hypothetical protein